MKHYQKLEHFAAKEIQSLAVKLIVSDGKNGYNAFGKYHVVPSPEHVVVNIRNKDSLTFGSKRSAISWCVADHLNQHALARSIHLLDNKKHSLAADIQCRRALAERSHSQDFYESVTTKIQSKVAYYNTLTQELEKCINSAKYWQIRGFSNETERPGRTASHKTNRQSI
jgi:hypothetical protein